MERRAFTAVEALLTIGVIAVTAGVSIPMYRNYQIRSDLDLAVEQTLQGLRRAQLLSQAGEQDNVWGFHVPTGTLYQGDNYLNRIVTSDEVYAFSTTIGVSGLTDITFTRVDGAPMSTGDIVFQAINGEQRIITVGDSGVLSASGILPAEEIPGGDTGGDSGGTTGGETGSATGGTTGSTTGGTAGGDTGTTGGAAGGTTGGAGGSGDDDDEITCEDRFAVSSDGTIETTGSVDARLEVLGSAITYGAGGPEVQVKTQVSLDGGTTWAALFGNQDIDGGEVENIENLPSGTRIMLRFNGRHSWYFNKTYTSADRTGHVLVLRDGDSLPEYDAFDQQENLMQFLGAIIDDQGRIDIGEHDAVFLTELGNLNSSSSDFQDAVVLLHFAAKEGSCAQPGDAKFKVVFDRLQNSGQGNAVRRIYVGPYAIAYAEDQWIPLEVAGQPVLDSDLSENVFGLAVRRESGQMRVRALGSHPSSAHKEIVDARIIFDRAAVTSMSNDAGQDASEEPFDGIVNDGDDGDEAVAGNNGTVVTFKSRVTTADDGIVLSWTEAAAGADGGTAGGDTGSAAGGETGADTDGTTGGETGDTSGTAGESGGDTGGDDIADPCAAGYTIANDGRIVLTESADVTFEVLGSHSLLGTRGPEIQARVTAVLGSSAHALFGFRDIDGGESQTFRSVPANTAITLSVEGQYSWMFRQRAESNDGTGRIRIHRRGSAVPGTTPYANPAQLQRFPRNDSQNGSFAVDAKAVLFLVEMQEVAAGSDYQDAAILVYLEKPASGGLCSGQGGETSGASSSSAGTGGSAGSANSSASSASSAAGQTVTICHYPGGSTANAHTLTVGANAWASHQAHGDRMGACESDEDGDGVANSSDLCPGTYVPESVPREQMLFERYALTQRNSTVFRVGPRKKVSDYNLQDTRGCSCEQIIDVAENVNAYHFGQFPALQRNVRSLFPFYTNGARNNGCSAAVLDMVRRG